MIILFNESVTLILRMIDIVCVTRPDQAICFPLDPPEMLESTGFCLGSIFCSELELGRCSGGGLRGECLTKSEPGKDSLDRSIRRVAEIDTVRL